MVGNLGLHSRVAMRLFHELHKHFVTQLRPLVQDRAQQLVGNVDLGVPVDRLLSVAAVQQDAVEGGNGFGCQCCITDVCEGHEERLLLLEQGFVVVARHHTHAEGEQLIEGDGCRSGLNQLFEAAGLGGNGSVVLFGLGNGGGRSVGVGLQRVPGKAPMKALAA